MVNENIKIRVQIGTVSHPQIYVRATVHNDPNERSKIASAWPNSNKRIYVDQSQFCRYTRGS